MYRKLCCLLLSIASVNAAAHESCRQPIDYAAENYIVGYGSLIETSSRLRTNPDALEVLPIEVAGYKRGWYVRGGEGIGTTFLGVTASKKGLVTAVYYPISAEQIEAVDKREFRYCRSLLKTEDLKSLSDQPIRKGDYWIYTIAAEHIKLPNAMYPIVQSYVDIFVSGCLEIAEKYRLDNFAINCIKNTDHWSLSWVNDRIYPRRPLIYQKNAYVIDRLLKQELPQQFAAIKIE